MPASLVGAIDGPKTCLQKKTNKPSDKCIKRLLRKKPIQQTHSSEVSRAAAKSCSSGAGTVSRTSVTVFSIADFANTVPATGTGAYGAISGTGHTIFTRVTNAVVITARVDHYILPHHDGILMR